MTGQAGNDGAKGIQTKMSLKYLSNFGGTLQISLINCKNQHLFNLV